MIITWFNNQLPFDLKEMKYIMWIDDEPNQNGDVVQRVSCDFIST